MKKLALLFLLVSTVSFSQTIEAELGTFDELKVFNGLYVTLKKADSPSIEISGDKAQEVVYKNVNGRLKLSMRFLQTFNAYEAQVTIFYTDDLKLIDVNEGSLVSSIEKITQQNIELKAQEGATIDLELDVKFLTIRSVTGGKILLKGKAENQDIEANTGGVYKAYGLKTSHTTITSSSGAYAEVTVSEVLDAKIRFGGTVYYKGSPGEVKKEKIIGGTIKSKD